METLVQSLYRGNGFLQKNCSAVVVLVLVLTLFSYVGPIELNRDYFLPSL